MQWRRDLTLKVTVNETVTFKVFYLIAKISLGLFYNLLRKSIIFEENYFYDYENACKRHFGQMNFLLLDNQNLGIILIKFTFKIV